MHIPTWIQANNMTVTAPDIHSIPQPSTRPGPKVTEVYSLEQEVVAVKLKHPDLVLFVECGYNFGFFGEDADLASRIYLLFSLIITSTQPVSRVCVSRTTVVASSKLATRTSLFVRLRRVRSNMPVPKHRVPLHGNSVRSTPEV
jgi:hypothetical protein